MASQGGSSRRSLSITTSSLHGKKKSMDISERGPDTGRRSFTVSRSPLGLTGGERTVKRLRLSKALTVPATTTIYEACKRMASRRVDALLLTDSNEMLCGILTDKDIATRVISQEVNVEETPVSKVMTRNPMFVLSETLAVDALQKMVLGKFRHLPVVENGEVIALLDIAKCLYDAIARMERAAEKGKAIAAAVEGVEKSWGTNTSVPNTFIETLRDRMFRPSLSTIIPDDTKVLKVLPTDTVLTVAKKMVEFQSSCAVVMIEDKLQGIFTSKDILMRVVAENLPPSETPVEKVMTQNPESTTVETPIVEALHIMHEGKFLHLPVTDKEGDVVAVVDVIHVTHAAVATAGTTAGIGNEATNTMMQKFWDSAMAVSPNEDDEDSRSETSMKVASEADTGKSFPFANTFSFKIEDKKHRKHRFISDTRSLTEVVTAILQRVGDDIDPDNLPQILYEDEDHDKVLLASDSDLQAAIDHAKSIGWKSLRLHLDDSREGKGRRRRASVSAEAMEMKEGRKRDRKAASEQDVETQPTRKKRTHLSKSPDLGIVKPREKKAESSLKLSFTERLRNLGFRIVTIDGDGNCLFRAILHQIHGDDKDHATLRTNVVGYMKRHPERFDEECRDSSLSYHAYCESMKRDKIYGGFAELAAAAQVTRSRIRLYYDDSENYTDIEPFAGYVAERTIFLSYHGRIHFNSLAKIIEGETSPDSGMGIAREKKEAETEGLPDSGMEIARKVHISNRPNIVWWDGENIEVPTELDHSLARYRIIKKMRDYGFRGPVKFKVVVGYLDSNVPKMKNIEIMYANKCIRPTRITKGNQAADFFLREKIKSWVVENPQPHNVFFFSGDHGFDKVLPLFADHRLILVLQESQGVENASVDLIWNWRNCLGVPSRVYKNPNAQKEAGRKRARSKAHLKAKTKKSKQDRAAAVAKAQDENVPIPKSISQDGTRVQIVIYLEIHIQEPAIISVENDHIHVAAPQAGRVLELIARRVGKPMKEITVQNVGDSKWIVQVENIAARDVFWKLVKAASY